MKDLKLLKVFVNEELLCTFDYPGEPCDLFWSRLDDLIWSFLDLGVSVRIEKVYE